MPSADGGNRSAPAADAPRNARPTLKDIAFMTGLGVATVSRALNDAPDIGQSTKERVRLVAKQIGYRPNRAGVRLRTGKTNVISLVLNQEDQVVDLMPKLMYGISETLVETPYHLIVTPYLPKSDPLDPVCYVVETGSADGIIISRTQPDDPRVRYLVEHGFPFATHGRTDMGIVHPFHDFDNEAYARMAIDWLVERGRKRVTLLGPPAGLTYSGHSVGGFVAAVQHHDLIEVPLHANTDTPHEEIVAEVAKLMRSRNRPDGIVCSGPGASLAAVSGVELAGFTVGQEVDIVGKQSFPFKLRPAMHVIYEDHRAAGRNLARAVMQTIDGVAPEKLQTLELPVALPDDAWTLPSTTTVLAES